MIATASSDRTIRLWSVATRQLYRTLAGHTGPVTSIAFSADGRWLLSGSSDKTALLFDTSSGQISRALVGHTDIIGGVAFKSDGLLVTASYDGTVRLWNHPLSDWESHLCASLFRDLNAAERTQFGIGDPQPTCSAR